MNTRKLLHLPAAFLVPGLLGLAFLQARAAIPTEALMKEPSGGDWVFKSQYVLDPSGPNPAGAIQARINAIADAPSSRGGVVFLKSGTYTITSPITLRGPGVQIVGLRDPVTGKYPTLQYGSGFSDTEYSVSASNRILQQPALIRVKGADYASNDSQFKCIGIYGLNIEYTGTSALSDAGKATAIAMHRPDFGLFRDITITNARNGIDVGACGHPRFQNIKITGVDGDFGFRAGITPDLSNPFKIHGIEITAKAGNTTTDLLNISANLELVGARLIGGKAGVRISGPDWDDAAVDVCLRSVLIQDTAEQGIVIGNALNLYLTDLQIDRAGAEAIKVLGGWDAVNNRPTGMYGGLQIANLRATSSGLSAIRVQSGMNICLTNAVLLNSGQKKSTLPANSPDRPIAGLSIDESVTSLNIVGARIGASGTTTPNEDYGIYWSTTGTLHSSMPWHTPTIIASNVNFFPNVSGTNIRRNDRSPKPNLTLSSVGAYNTLADAGHFNPPPSESWTIQKLASDPQLDGGGWFTQVRGYNFYDLPEIRDKMWIDLTKTNVISGTVPNFTIDSDKFTALLNDPDMALYQSGVVLYLPAGSFLASGTYQRKLYTLTKRLLINKPNVQLLGDGRDVTQISIPHQTASATLPPRDNAIKIVNQGTNPEFSGIFGLSVYYDLQASMPDTGMPAGGWGPAITYAPPFRVEGAERVRLAGLGTMRGMGGGVSIVDSKDVELFDLVLNAGANNSQPSAPNPVISVIGTTPGATSDIRMYQVFGGFLGNIWLPTPAPAKWMPDNHAGNLTSSQIPELTWIRLNGNVQRVRIDYSTFVQGKNGLETVANYGGVPADISTCRIATDHVYCYGAHLMAGTNADFHTSWLNGSRHGPLAIDSAVTGTTRLHMFPARGGGLEGLLIQQQGTVSLVNCLVGINYYPVSYRVLENRPKSGIYLGSALSSAKMIGGCSGWLFNSNRTAPGTNVNTQDWGIVLGIASPNFTNYGADLMGNVNGGIGLQNTAVADEAIPYP